MAGWQFWVDRGGTFTDLIAQTPSGELLTHKLLSVNPNQYQNSAIQGIRDLLNLSYEEAIPTHLISQVKVGTTVATNALLERKGELTALVTTEGFADVLKIANQNRPDIFALNIELPEQLYCCAIEIKERMNARGEIVNPIEIAEAKQKLIALKEQGIKAIAIVLMHTWINPQHEQALALLAAEVGFEQISVSHEVSATIKVIPRGDTTVVDAYLTPVMQKYVQQIADQLPNVELFFMQSNGGLASSIAFKGKDAVLSGPAGGIVGAVSTSAQLGFDKIIGFDMGGTSTDVSHCLNQAYEKTYQTQVAGVRLAVPMMNIHTVAAGGGSVCQYRDGRFQVGPDSAGSFPGPACYRQGGPLTVTDCNVVLGKINAAYFPAVFGDNANLPLDMEAAIAAVKQVQAQLLSNGVDKTLAQIAQGFIAIAVENMANAVRKISTQRGYHLSDYALTSFGGAGGQHACLIADALDIDTILIHPYAGVLSAYGIGLAEQIVTQEQSVQVEFTESNLHTFQQIVDSLTLKTRQSLNAQGVKDEYISSQVKAHLKYAGAEVIIEVDWHNYASMCNDFECEHKRLFTYYSPELPLVLDALSVDSSSNLSQKIALSCADKVSVEQILTEGANAENATLEPIVFYSEQTEYQAPCYRRDQLKITDVIKGPAVIIEKTGTNIIENGWQAEVIDQQALKLTRMTEKVVDTLTVDPINLEVFNNLFMVIAEQMGSTLQKTAHSVNIRERLDFSCALFDQQGELVANAPHVPVHLGSMSHSVKSILAQFTALSFNDGDAFLINSPYHGGTHLPDLTLITPVFIHGHNGPAFFVASRAHHADVGGISPGSMPSNSQSILDEGLIFTGVKISNENGLDIENIRVLFSESASPARNITQNIADLTAQYAANKQGVKELQTLCSQYGFNTVNAFMQAILDNAELAVENVITKLKEGACCLTLDTGAEINVAIKVNQQTKRVLVDFTGTSVQQSGNFNAPRAVTDAAVIYVFRTLVKQAIPLNAGCMRPIDVIAPQGSMLSPVYPAAVVAGNVEVSQAIVSALLLALGQTAASQTTMNNLTFGNADYQYYETLAGGTGAGITLDGDAFSGCDAVHSHMTNSRLTDPEILEQRFPVELVNFSIRQDSGGDGCFKGGNGIVRSMLFKESMMVSIMSNSRVIPPLGLEQGKNGLPGEGLLQRHHGKTEILNSNCTFNVEKGDVLIIKTPGGGGYTAYNRG
ncbi:hydantoinase B/oxoprolinase family protein [Algibacillus agarilyticus]|uniref:hydantoinase B/oxoprolinase family protein n=1 Tax=Algibacillus agarilyticus TaxID=2234133 RepID=UPI000DD032FE|nr:hydantoinase B/oxoprolinase family protein [Algibacillus agarilyticus]